MPPKKKKGGPFEDPTLNAFYKSIMAQSTGTPDTTPYQWNKKDLAKAQARAKETNPARGKARARLVEQGIRYPTVAQLNAEVERERQKNARYGGTNENRAERGGVLSDILNFITRPNSAVMQGFIRAGEKPGRENSISLGKLADFGEGFWEGLSGKKHTTGSDVLRQEAPDWSKKHGKLAATVGFVGDVGLDPTTYLGIGLASRVGRVGQKSLASKQMRETLKQVGVKDEDVIKTLTHQAYTSGKQTVQAAKAARKTVDEAADFAAKVEFDKVYQKLVDDGLDATRARGQAQIAKGQMQVQLRKMADDILNAPGYRNIAIKAGSGLGMKGIEIPLSRYAVQAAAAPFKGLGKWDPARKAADTFTELFSNSAKIFPELQQLRLEHRSSGLARVHARGEYLTKTFKKFSKEDRKTMLADALAGNFNTGKTIVDYAGNERDAGEWIVNRLRTLQRNFADPQQIHYDLVLEPEDINRFSKYAGIHFKKAHKNDQDWILNSLKDAKVKDAGEALFVVESALEQALARRTMLKSFADTWGARTGTIADLEKKFGFKKGTLPPELRPYRNAKQLQSEGWTTVTDKSGKVIKELDGILFDPDTAHGMKKILNLLEDEREIQAVLQGINKYTGMWKFFVTVPNPGFHIRNSIGDMYINMMDDVSGHAYGKAGQLIHQKKLFEVPGAGETSPLMMQSHQHIMQAARSFQPLSGKYTKSWLKLKKPLKDNQGNTIESLTPAEVWAAYNRYGMRQNYTISEYGKAFDEKSLRGSLLSKAKDPLVRWSENREDYFRLAHFMHLVEKNPSKAKDLDSLFSFAAQRVRKTHFDYTDFTKFEKQVMSNVIPFYKWTRKSLPLQTELLFTQPGRVAVIPKIMRSVSELSGYDWEDFNYLRTERVIPQWMRDTGYVPTKLGLYGISGGPQDYINVASPFGDAANQWAAPLAAGSVQGVLKQVASQLNPALKAPAEVAMNQRFFTGQSIKPRGEPTRGESFRSYADYLSEQTPATRILGKAFQNEDTTPAAAWSWLLGVSIAPNTESRQLSELYRARDNTRGRFRQTREKYLKRRGLREDYRLR